MELTQADFDVRDVVSGGVILPPPAARLIHLPPNAGADRADMAWSLYLGNNVIFRGADQPFDFSKVLLGSQLDIPFFSINLAPQFSAIGRPEPRSVSRTHAVLTLTRGHAGHLLLHISSCSASSVSLTPSETTSAASSSSSPTLWTRCVLGIPQTVPEGVPFIMGAEHFLWQQVPGGGSGGEAAVSASAPVSPSSTAPGYRFPGAFPLEAGVQQQRQQAAAALPRAPVAIPLVFQATMLEESGMDLQAGGRSGPAAAAPAAAAAAALSPQASSVVGVSPIAPVPPNLTSPLVPSLPLPDFGSQSQSQQGRSRQAVGGQQSQQPEAAAAPLPPVLQPAAAAAAAALPATYVAEAEAPPSQETQPETSAASSRDASAAVMSTTEADPQAGREGRRRRGSSSSSGGAVAAAASSEAAADGVRGPISPGVGFAATQIAAWEPTQASPGEGLGMEDDESEGEAEARRTGGGQRLGFRGVGEDEETDTEGTQLHASPMRGRPTTAAAAAAAAPLPLLAAPSASSRGPEELLDDAGAADTSRAALEAIRSRYAIPHPSPQVLSNPHEIASLDDAYDVIEYPHPLPLSAQPEPQMQAFSPPAPRPPVPGGAVPTVTGESPMQAAAAAASGGAVPSAAGEEEEEEEEEVVMPPPAKRARQETPSTAAAAAAASPPATPGQGKRGGASSAASSSHAGRSPSLRPRGHHAAGSAPHIRVAFTLFESKKDEPKYADIVRSLGGIVVPEVVAPAGKTGGGAASSSSSSSSSADDGPHCTHLVCPRIGSSAKFLEALCVCPWIVTPAWLDESAARGGFIDLTPETVAPFLPPAPPAKIEGCPPIDELHKLIKRRVVPCRPLAGVSFYLLPGFGSAASQMGDVIQLCGGSVLSEPPVPKGDAASSSSGGGTAAAGGVSSPPPPSSSAWEQPLGVVLKQPPLLTRRRAAIKEVILAPPKLPLSEEAKEVLLGAYGVAPPKGSGRGASASKGSKSRGKPAPPTTIALPSGVLLCRSGFVRQCIFHLSVSEQVVKANKLSEEEVMAGEGEESGGGAATTPAAAGSARGRTRR